MNVLKRRLSVAALVQVVARLSRGRPIKGAKAGRAEADAASRATAVKTFIVDKF
jgi:hypothetical protein